MKPSQVTLTEADYHLAAMRADHSGLLAIPQQKREPPRWPLYAMLVTIALALGGLVALRHAPLRFVHAQCNPRFEEGCK